MNVMNLPKQEDVESFELGNGQTASVVKLTDENRAGMFEVVMQTYLNDVCMYCHKGFTREQLNTAKWAHPNEEGRIVHKQCWDSNNPKKG